MARHDRAVILSRADWKRVQGSQLFWDLLRVARITNGLTLAYPPLKHRSLHQTPKARRERTAAFLYAGALLSEGLQVARGLGTHFAELPQFQSGFGRIFADPKTDELQAQFLRPLRNKATFHIDREVFEVALKELDFSSYNLALATDWRAGSIYFSIVDDAVLVFLIRPRDDQDYLQRLDDYMTRTARLCNAYLRAAHSLLPIAFRRLGARKTKVPRPEVSG